MKTTTLLAVSAAVASSVAMIVSGASATEYVELDYVEATGAQWVDTGLIGRCGTKAEIKVEWTDLSADVSMLACRRDSGNTRINLLNANGVRIGYGYGTYTGLTYNGCECFWEKGRIYTVVTDFAVSGDGASVSLTIDGISLVNQSYETQVNTETNLVVFGNNYGGVVGLAKARCYGLKIWQDGTLVRDFIPVSVNGRAGFRDSVSGDFFYSASGTDLIAGTLANEPDRFVDYIESSGNEYLDLEVIGKSGVKMASRMMWMEIPSDGSYVASRLGSTTRFYLMHHYGSQTIGYGAYNQTGVGATAGTVYDITTDLKVGSQTCVVNGSSIYTASNSSEIVTSLNLYLFGCNKDGGVQYKSKARCYSLKLWDGETLVRDFRPCLKNGEACLYDEVSRRIFRTKSGTLKFGGVLPTSGKPDYFVTYIESKGNNYLDTGVRARNNLRVAGDFNYTQSRTDSEETYVYLEPASKRERTLVGACASDSGNRCYAVHVNAKALWFGYGDRKVYPGTDGVNYYPGTGRHQFEATLANGVQSVTIDGNDLALSGDVASYDIDAGCNLYLFACNKGGIAQYQSNARCYYLKIWQNNTLVRDLRPCVKDGTAGFYDYVNDEIIYTVFSVDPSCIGEKDFTDEDFEAVRGGRKSIDGDYEVHTFTSSGTLIVKGRGAMDVLVVGGGGGGGSRNAGGGGGGGGGVIYRTSFAVTSGVYQVVVGAGGAGGSNDWGNNGGDSSIMGFVAKGGGGGGGAYASPNTHYTGRNGGSGGGGSGAGSGTAAAGTGTPEQGKNGGSGALWSGGGGGGATVAGGVGTEKAKAGDGGAGFVCSITGSEVCYGSGGGGGTGDTAANNNNGTGGANGGDGGAYDGSNCSPGGNGVDGTGGGGGGGGGYTGGTKYALGGNGGSGVVIIRCKYIPCGTTISIR